MISLFIRSFLFWLYSTITIPLYSLICVFCAFFPLNTRHAIIRVYLKTYFSVLKTLCHIDYQITGLENIPKNQSAVILSKHQSTFETFLLPLIFHAPAVIVKRELLWIPFFGWALRTGGPIAIDRKNTKSSMMQILEQGKAMLHAGRWVLLFPEGTRIPYGKVGHYRLGGARLAVDAHVPVIPVAHDAGKVWPRRRFIKYPGTVHMVIGPAIATDGRTPEAVLADTKQWIESTIVALQTMKETE